LYHYKAGNKDAQDSYENLICFKNVSKKIWMPKYNLHMLWTITSSTFVF
jgi:hypothetical protein